MNKKDLILIILLATPRAIGWIAGFAAKCARLTWAAITTGYEEAVE